MNYSSLLLLILALCVSNAFASQKLRIKQLFDDFNLNSLQNLNTDNAAHPLEVLPQLIRMAFHDAAHFDQFATDGIFRMGCFVELMSSHGSGCGAHAGMNLAIEMRDAIFHELLAEGWNPTHADLTQVLGGLAVDSLSEGTGFVETLFDRVRLGRPDVTNCADVCNLLPEFHAGGSTISQRFKNVWEDEVVEKMVQNMGLNENEAIALLGAHTVGRVRSFFGPSNHGPWTMNPFVFDNSYFQELVTVSDSVSDCGVTASQVNDPDCLAPFTRMFPNWFQDASGRVVNFLLQAQLLLGLPIQGQSSVAIPPLMLDVDLALQQERPSIVKSFADDFQLWRTVFNDAYIKMSELGVAEAGISMNDDKDMDLPQQGCGFVPASVCPPPTVFLTDCSWTMAPFTSCEAETSLPDGNVDFQINNCNGKNVWSFECIPQPEQPPVDDTMPLPLDITTPTAEPTNDPTQQPTNDPTQQPTNDPTQQPTNDPTRQPTNDPTQQPTKIPTASDILSDMPTATATTQQSSVCVDDPNGLLASLNWGCDNLFAQTQIHANGDCSVKIGTWNASPATQDMTTAELCPGSNYCNMCSNTLQPSSACLDDPSGLLASLNWGCDNLFAQTQIHANGDCSVKIGTWNASPATQDMTTAELCPGPDYCNICGTESSQSACSWVPISPADCPPDGALLSDCHVSMSEGELCEADSPLPNGETNIEVNNCGGFDVYRFECGTPQIPPTNHPTTTAHPTMNPTVATTLQSFGSCAWIPLSSAECPSDNGASLSDCTDDMSDGELCEADSILPSGETNYNINNCGAYDVFRYDCQASSTCNVDIQRVSVTPGNNPCAGQNCATQADLLQFCGANCAIVAGLGMWDVCALGNGQLSGMGHGGSVTNVQQSGYDCIVSKTCA